MFKDDGFVPLTLQGLLSADGTVRYTGWFRTLGIAAFVLSGFLAGVAGALYLSFQQSFTTSQMGLTPMSIYVTMLVIGGLGTVTGPIIGTVVVTAIQTKLINYPGWTLTVLGASLLVIVVFVPGGFVGVVSRINRRIAAWVGEEEDLPPGDPEPDQRLVA